MNIVLYPPSNSVILNFLNLHINYYGIIMSCAIFAGIILSAYLVNKNLSKSDYEIYMDFIPYSIIFAIIGARLFYVIGEWEFYSKNLSEIILINHGGISIYGAIIFGLLSIFLFSKLKKFSMLKFCDYIAVVMPLCQAIGRWGNFFNQEAYGSPSNYFLKMYIDPNHRYSQFSDVEYYHPTFLYECALNIFLFALLFFIFSKFKKLKTGTITCLYLFLYSIIRIFIENIRIDSVLNISNIPIATIISILIIIFSLILFYKINRKN